MTTVQPSGEPAAAPAAAMQPQPARPATSASNDHGAPPSVASRLLNGAARPQITGSDLRTERLVRGVRGEVESLRALLAGMRPPDVAMTAADVEAIVADPEGAALVPPAMLVGAIVHLHEANQALSVRATRLERKLESARARNRDLKQERWWFRGRLQTLEDVIAALHANIEDLRLQRDRATPELDTAAKPAVLPAGPTTPRALRGAPEPIAPLHGDVVPPVAAASGDA